MRREVHTAELFLAICEEGHVHLNLRATGGIDCPDLGVAMDASDARELAMELLKSANELSPPS